MHDIYRKNMLKWIIQLYAMAIRIIKLYFYCKSSKTKYDQSDSKNIGLCFWTGLVQSSYIITAIIQILFEFGSRAPDFFLLLILGGKYHNKRSFSHCRTTTTIMKLTGRKYPSLKQWDLGGMLK